MTPPTQICRTCKQVKSLDEFHKANDRPSGHSGQCKACNKKARKEFYEQHPGYAAIETRRKRYGLEHDEYMRMQENQQGKCFICKEEKNLHVDHDHSSQKVRALLCNECNSVLGYSRENPEILQAGIEYLLLFKAEEETE